MDQSRQDLQAIQEKIKKDALDYGLDFFETIFELLDFDQMNEIASYGGFANRYPHWRFGMEYEQTRKSYAYGLHRIYELVINNDPAYAYLLHSNNWVDQKLVIAHVYAHVDFFKNNYWFAPTNRHMVDEMANHATRIRRYIEKYGWEVVEDFIDKCLSLENLIDYHAPYITRKPKTKSREEEEPNPRVYKLKSKQYMDSFVNPKEFLEKQKEQSIEESKKNQKFPAIPEKDVLQFLIEHAPLKRWQQDVLSIIREEAYYFAPQIQTKIMNEGWATFWHSKMMTEKILSDAEVVDYADHHSGTMTSSPRRLNPYKLGVELFRDIKERWDKGRFGKAYEECDDFQVRANWDQQLGLGMEKIFEVRKFYNDVTFIDAFLTEDFAREQKLFTYEYDRKDNQFKIASREFQKIKQKLLYSLTNLGQPYIYVENGNYGNRGELLLVHRYDGVGLEYDYARETLKNLFSLWTRPVLVESYFNNVKGVLSFNGEDFKLKKMTEKTEPEKEKVAMA